MTMEASSWRDLFVAVTALVTMRAVSIPSPEVRPGRMTWPFCSLPILISCSSMAATTFGSPTAVISAWISLDLAHSRRP